MAKSYRVTHVDRDGNEVEDIVWASSPAAARKAAAEQFDDVIDVVRNDGSGIVPLAVVILLAAAFLAVLVMYS